MTHNSKFYHPLAVIHRMTSRLPAGNKVFSAACGIYGFYRRHSRAIWKIINWADGFMTWFAAFVGACFMLDWFIDTQGQTQLQALLSTFRAIVWDFTHLPELMQNGNTMHFYILSSIIAWGLYRLAYDLADILKDLFAYRR